MGLVKFTNNATGTTTTSLSSGGTTFTLQSGQGALFPTLLSGEYCYVRLGTDSLNEVVKVTARSGDVFTCVATTSAWAAGTPVILSMAAETLSDMAQTYGNGDILDGHRLQNYSEQKSEPASTSGALAIDFSDGPVFKITLSENITTLSLLGAPASPQSATIVMIFTQNATGGWGVTWPASVNWVGADPIFGKLANDVSVVMLQTVNGGSSWYGYDLGQSNLSMNTQTDTPVSMASGTWNSDLGRLFTGTFSGAFTVAASSGTPFDGQKVMMLFTQGSGSAMVPTWDSSFVAGSNFSGTIPAPSTTTGDITAYGWMYIAYLSKWHLLAQEVVT